MPQQLFDNTDATNRFTGSATLSNHPTDWFTQRAVLGLDYIGEDRRAIEHFSWSQIARRTHALYASLT